MTDTPSTALEARNLRLSYGSATALHDFSLRILAGEHVGIIGRSGSGKTGLARLLTGLPPAGATVSGNLHLPGRMVDLAKLTPRLRRRSVAGQIGWLPQDAQAALHPTLRIGSQIAETLRAAGRSTDRAVIAGCLAEVELESALMLRYPHQVSGGQAQRVALACVLAQSPTILVADEPTSALDAKTGSLVLAMLAQAARQRGLALVLVTHDLEMAWCCDRLIVLDGGIVVETGPANEILSAPQSPAAQTLVSAAQRLAASC